MVSIPFRSLRILALIPLLLAGVAASADPRLWFVDNTHLNGDGSSTAPFATIGAATAAAAPGDVIYVMKGSAPYRERVVMGARQLLAGHGSDITAQLTERGIPAEPSLPSLPSPPLIEGGEGDALMLAGGGAVIGVKLRSTSGRALVMKDVGGSITVRDSGMETVNGTAVAIEGGDANADFARVTVAASTGTAFSIHDRTGGTLRFREDSTITVTAGTREAFVLERNQGDYTFEGAVRATTSGARAVVIRSSSRVAMTSPESTVATTKATAVDIADTGISVFFRSVSVDGAGGEGKHGISLENAPGTFRVDGGTIRNVAARGISIVRSSGVTLQNIVLENNGAASKPSRPCATLAGEEVLDCSASIYLAAVTDVRLSRVRVDKGGHTGILGDEVTNLTLDTVTVEDAGDEAGEHGIAIRGLHGRSQMFDSTVKDSSARQLSILNRDGEGELEIRKCRFDGGPPPAGQQGLLLELDGSARMSVAIDDSEFTEHFSDAIHAIAGGTASLEVFVYNSRFNAVSSAVNLVVNGEAHLAYRVTGSSIRGATAAAISVNAGITTGTAEGVIAENTIGVAGVAGSGAKCGTCSGITVRATRGGKVETTIRGNTIRQVDGYAIHVNARGTARLAATITGNTIAEPHGANVLNAIALQAGALSSDTARLCADVSANRIGGAWDPQGGGAAIATSSRGAATVAVAGMAGDTSDAAAVKQHLSGRNGGAAVKVSGTSAAVKSCS